jgi:hypothetical protein
MRRRRLLRLTALTCSSVERDPSSAGQRRRGQLRGLPGSSIVGGRLPLDRDSGQLELLSLQFDHRLKGGVRFARSHDASLFVPLRPDVEMSSP